MRTRDHDWFNTKTHEVFLGIQVKDTDGKWKHYVESKNNEVWLTKDAKVRELKRTELRKIKLVKK